MLVDIYKKKEIFKKINLRKLLYKKNKTKYSDVCTFAYELYFHVESRKPLYL